MKILSITVPCYNSAAYMKKCLGTLLKGGDDVEILIVDDGSKKDDTPAIADAYEKQYPGICRAIHQVNKGHGGAINAGLKNATGVYFKVVDSDDWVNEEAYQKILDSLKKLHQQNSDVDCVFSNFIYDNVIKKTRYCMQYAKFFPEEDIFGWDDFKPLGPATYVLMHSIIYRTDLLRNDVKLQLPEHTYYEDNIYAFEPFAKVSTMYYINVDFYNYFIGRSDQSVNTDVMIGRAEQQYGVNKRMVDFMIEQHELVPAQKKFMAHYLTMILCITTIIMDDLNTPERMRPLWDEIEKNDLPLYKDVCHSLIGTFIHKDGKVWRDLISAGYRASRHYVGFN